MYDGWPRPRSSQPVHQAPAIKTLGMTNIFLSLCLSFSPLQPHIAPCHSSTHSEATTNAVLCPLTFLTLPPVLLSYFNCPPETSLSILLGVKKKTSFILYFPDNLLFLSSFSSLFSSSPPPFYWNSPFPYKMKIHLELHLMSSLCLLSVDDVYEELRRAAECLMMHKIKPSLSAVLRLPSASQAADTRWGNRLQTAIRWTGKKGKPTSSLCVSRGGEVWCWCRGGADKGGSESWHGLQK